MKFLHSGKWIELGRWTLFGVSIVLFVISLVLPALLFEEVEPVRGSTLLVWGWWGLILGNPAWCANPIFFVALLTFFAKRYMIAQITGTVAILLGAFSFFANEYYFNEASSTPIAGLGLAFYVWMFSFGVLSAGSLALFLITKTNNTQVQAKE
jgi:hypothetical protein